MKQDGRTLLHLINLTGHSQTAYFPPIPVHNIEISLEGAFTSARALRSSTAISLKRSAGRTAFTLATLTDYDLLILE
jgi:hypothetical protein